MFSFKALAANKNGAVFVGLEPMSVALYSIPVFRDLMDFHKSVKPVPVASHVKGR